jgi:opacity protein-like surface antigen
MKKLFALFLALGFLALNVRAQTPPALGQYQFGAGYASVSGPTDNGTLLTASKQFSPRVWGQAKGFMLANPAGVLIASVGPRYRPPLSALLKPSGYFDSSKWYPFLDLNLGAVKDPAGVTKFAYGVGAGLDYEVASNVTLLLGEIDYYRSSFFPSGGILVTNIRTVTAGVKFTFAK